MLVCVDGNLVGEKVSDHVPSPLRLARPRSDPEPESRSPKIHTSTLSMPAAPVVGSEAFPVIVYEAPPDALTFAPSVGCETLTTGPLPADAEVDFEVEGAGADAAAPPPVTLTVLNHQPLPPVCT